MFQTEVIIFIQSFASDIWTFFFAFWTEIGYTRSIILIIAIILFGISYRIGYILMQAVALNGLLTLYLKELFILPRPYAVDLNVKLLESNLLSPTPFENMGAKSFFGALPEDVVRALRANPIGSWGFPSGHTSNAMTFGGLISVVFKKTWLKAVAAAVIIFIPFSRIYLGRHFLADIMGGYFIGFLVALVFYNFVYKSDWIRKLFERRDRLSLDLRIVGLFFYLFLLPFLLLIILNINSEAVAGFLGLNLGFFLVWIRGIPSDVGTAKQRILRVLTAFATYYVSHLVLTKFSELLCQREPNIIEFFRVSLTVILLIWGSTELSIKLGFFKRLKKV
jgi:membrane-associated phospholipid phosphatase